MNMAFSKELLKTQIQNLPHSPGIYKFKNVQNKIIYIGKAKNLKHRVGSYFSSVVEPNSKTGQLVAQIHSVEVIEVKSEVEALILEAYLIGKHKPFYNIVLKDDKSFLYIEILQEKVKIDGKETLLPRVKVSRKGDIIKSSVVFGPFPNSSATRFVLRNIRRHFPYRDCSLSKFNLHNKMGKPCLYGDLGLCSAPCSKNITPAKYRGQISKIKDFLNGKSSKIISSLEKKMLIASKNQQYEEAGKLRDRLRNFNYVREKRIPANLYVEKPDLLQDLQQKSLTQLRDAIPILKEIPTRIECFDIANLGMDAVVGSMVVSLDGKLQRGLYRRFKIKTPGLKDDFARLAEVLYRRLRRGLLAEKDWEFPSLLVLDGGIPQLSVVMQVLKKMNLNYIPVIGIAKREEKLIYFDGGRFEEISLPKQSEALQLIIRMRDEAHRFAQDYHHSLRLRDIL